MKARWLLSLEEGQVWEKEWSKCCPNEVPLSSYPAGVIVNLCEFTKIIIKSNVEANQVEMSGNGSGGLDGRGVQRKKEGGGG